jgi:hypothetical protein
MATRIQVRRGTTSEWNTANPTLEEGEIGYNTTLGQMKIGDGSTSWGNLDYIVNSASLDTSLGSYIPDTEKSAVNGVAELDASKNILAPAGIIFEGTANDHETTLAVTDPTADRTITFPDATTTVVGTDTTQTLTNKTIDSPTITSTNGAAIIHGILLPSAHGISFEGATDNDFETILTVVDPTADRTITFPDATGTVALAANVAALSGATFTGAVSGTDLTLSGNLTVNGTTTNINSTNLVVEDKNIILGDVATPTDTTADGGGITLKGATDKTFNWVDATDAWTSSEHINLASAKSLYLNGTLLKDVTETLTNKTLTSPKINEDVALTATATELNYVDGVTSAIQTQLDGKVDESLFDVKGDILVASADNTPAKLGVGTNGYILTANSSATNGIEWAAAPISLPSQSGNSGKYLTTDGTTASWGTISSYSAPTIGSTSIASGATVTTIAGLTLSNATLSGSLTAGGGTGTSGQVLASTGSGVQWSTPSAGAAFSEFMLIGC